MNKKMVIIAAVALLAVVCAAFALTHRGTSVDESITARALRGGGSRIACEDALWLKDTFKQLVEEKKAQIPEGAEEDFTGKEFETMPTGAQKLLDGWRDGVVVAVAQTYVKDHQTLDELNDAIGRQFMEIYQAVMLAELGYADDEGLMGAVREEFCSE